MANDTEAMRAPFQAITSRPLKWPMPKTEGFYWAKWRMCDHGTDDEEGFTPSKKWEVVEVYFNSLDENDDEYIKVFVGGVRQSQSPENFFWGPGPLQVPSP